MKKITNLVLAILATFSLSAQINGNRNITTKTFSLSEIKSLEINLTADIRVDMAGKNEITITTDSNIIPYIGRSINRGKLSLDQKEWIESSSGIDILIGAPALAKIICDAHSNVRVENMSLAEFKANVNVGDMELLGFVENLIIKNKLGDIDASALKAENADITITGWGKVNAQVINRLTTSVSDDGRLVLVNTPKELLGDANNAIAKTKRKKVENKDIRFLKFELKNNSWNRHHYVVVGPKSDGTTFSYGFPMNPGQVRKKDWTNGTKLYQTNRLGIRKLILTIKETDEGKMVDIYE